MLLNYVPMNAYLHLLVEVIMPIKRLTAIFLSSVCLFSTTLHAQNSDDKNWPTKPIRWVVPYAPGGLSDTSTRIITKKISENTGWNIIVDNRPGANALIGLRVCGESYARWIYLYYSAC
jgi:hypothetical protein